MKLTLLVPGLLGPTGDFNTDDWLNVRPEALERLLSRARASASPVVCLHSGLAELFAISEDPLPTAALSFLSDTGEAPGGYLLRADPVHLRPDQATLRLFDSHTFNLDRDEADALVTAFNELYTDQGWRLLAPVPHRWYLRVPKTPQLTTFTPQQAAGRDINAFLPTGPDAPGWHAVLNEVQMLFHAHPVNQAREQRGEPLVNSLWFWGGGRLPGPVSCGGQRLWTDVPEAMGLARLAGIERRDLPDHADDVLAAKGRDAMTVVLDEVAWCVAYNDIGAWLEAIRRLEENWFSPLLAALRSGRVTELVILPGNGRAYRVTGKSLRAFWKPLRSLANIAR